MFEFAEVNCARNLFENYLNGGRANIKSGQRENYHRIRINFDNTREFNKVIFIF